MGAPQEVTNTPTLEETLKTTFPEVNPTLEGIKALSQQLGESIRRKDPFEILLDEVLQSMGINENLQFDPDIKPALPSESAVRGAGISVPEGAFPESEPAAPPPVTPPAADLPSNRQGLPPPPPIVGAVGGVAGSLIRMTGRAIGEIAVNTASTATDLSILIGDFIQNYLTPDFIKSAPNPAIYERFLGAADPNAKPGFEGDDVSQALFLMLDQIVNAPVGEFEQTVKDLAQILIAMAPIVKGLEAAGLGARSASFASSAIAETVAIDPNSPGFVSLIGNLAPGIQEEIKDFIKSTLPPDEAERGFQARLIERGFRGLTDGAMADTLWMMFGKLIKTAHHRWKLLKSKTEFIEEPVEQLPPEVLSLFNAEDAGSIIAKPVINKARRGIEAGQILTKDQIQQLPPEILSLFGNTTQLSVGVLAAGLIGSQIVSSSVEASDDELRVQMTQAGIGSDIAELLLKGIKRFFKSATDEEVEKITLRKAEKRAAEGKRLVNDGEFMREATEHEQELAAQFLKDQPERVVIDGKPRDINFNTIDSPAEFRKAMAQVSELFEPEITAKRRTNRGSAVPPSETVGVNRAEEARLARNMGLTIDDLHKFAQSLEMLPKIAVAANEILEASARRLVKLRDAVLQGDLNANEAFVKQFAMHAEIQGSVAKVGSEMGRGLNMFAVKPDGGIELLRRVRGRAIKLGQPIGVTVKELAQMHKNLDDLDPAKVRWFERSILKPTFGGALYEQWINFILSAAAIKNFAGNAMATALEVGERFMAANPLIRDNPIGIDESREKLFAMFGAAGDAWKLFARALKTGETAFPDQKFGAPSNQINRMLLETEPGSVANRLQERVRGISGSPIFDLSPDGWLGTGIDWWGKAVRLVGGGILRAQDDAFKLIHMRAELRALASREARQQGLKGEARTRFIDEFLENPAEEALQSAIKTREVLTFMDDLANPDASFQSLRKSGVHLQAMTKDIPALKLAFPFVRASINVPTYSMERVPGLALLSSGFRSQLRHADPEVRAKAMAKIGTSILFFTAMTPLVMSGRITGMPPADRRLARRLEQEHGIKWNSIRIGDKFISLDQIQPFGWIISAAATFMQAIAGDERVPDGEKENIASTLVLMNAQAFADQSWMMGMAKIMDAVQGGKYGQGDFDAVSRIMGDIVGGATVPAIVTQFNRLFIDPYKREYNNLLDPIKNRLPYFSLQQPAVVDNYGNEVLHTDGYAGNTWVDGPLNFIFPWKTFDVDPNSAKGIVAKHKLRNPIIGNMVAGINIGDKDANPLWQHRLRKLFGKEVKIGGRNFNETVEMMPRLEIWDQLSDGPNGGKQVLLDDIRKRFSIAAKDRLLREFDELLQKATEKKLNQRQKLLR